MGEMMKFKKTWDKIVYDDIGSVVEKFAEDDGSDRRGAVESVNSKVDNLIAIVAKMADLLAPAQQKELAERLCFDVVEE